MSKNLYIVRVSENKRTVMILGDLRFEVGDVTDHGDIEAVIPVSDKEASDFHTMTCRDPWRKLALRLVLEAYMAGRTEAKRSIVSLIGSCLLE